MGYKEQAGGGGLDASSGFLIRAAGQPHRSALPSWDHETQFRAFPAPKEDGSGFHPIRESAEDNDFGPAVWAEPVVRRLGVHEQFTFITRVPGHAGNSPTDLFCDALTELIADKPREVPEDWIFWPRGGKKQAAKLEKPKRCIFFQGMTIMAQGKLITDASGNPRPQFPSLLMGSTSLKIFFEQRANTRAQGYNGPYPSQVQGRDDNARRQLDQIYGAMFALGDWCSLEGGRIMHIYQAPPSGKFERPHYELKLGQPVPLQQYAQLVKSSWRPWDQLLRYFTVEQQIQLLCRAFPPEAVDFVFGQDEYKSMLPQSVRGAWQRYKSSQVAWSPGMAGPYRLPAAGAPSPVMGDVPSNSLQTGQPASGPASTIAPALPVGQQSVPQSAVAAPGSALQAGGMSFVMDGGAPAGEPSVMDSGAFGEEPAEFTAPSPAIGSLTAVLPNQVVPTAESGQIALPVTPTLGTPLQAATEVDAAKLASALTALEEGRRQAAKGEVSG